MTNVILFTMVYLIIKEHYCKEFYRISSNSFILNKTSLIGNLTFKNKFECFRKCDINNSCFLVTLKHKSCEMFGKLAWQSLKFNGTSHLFTNNFCFSSPCQNGGFCMSNRNGFKCDCTPFFIGPTCSQELDKISFKNHPSNVIQLATISNRYLISASSDGKISIWNLTNFKLVRNLTNRCSISCIILLSNEIIATGCQNGKIIIINLDFFEDVINAHNLSIGRMVYLKNGYLASGSSDMSIKIWNISNWRLISTMKGHTNEIKDLENLSNGDLASCSCDLSIIIWNPTTFSIKTKLNGHQDCVTRLNILNNGNLISASNDGTIRLWNTKTYTFINSFTTNGNPISLNNLADGNFISGQPSGVIQFWNINNGALIKNKNTNTKSRILFILTLPNGDIACSDSAGIITIWNKNYI